MENTVTAPEAQPQKTDASLPEKEAVNTEKEISKFLTYTEAKEEINKEVDTKLGTVLQRLEALEKNLSSDDYSKQIIQKVQRAFLKDDRLSPEPVKEKVTNPSVGDEEGIKSVQEKVNESIKLFRR